MVGRERSNRITALGKYLWCKYFCKAHFSKECCSGFCNSSCRVIFVSARIAIIKRLDAGLEISLNMSCLERSGVRPRSVLSGASTLATCLNKN